MGYKTQVLKVDLHKNAHVSKEYYMFHTKLQSAADSGNDPFSEPVLMYTNITGYKINVVL
jgi:hypothetical protein